MKTISGRIMDGKSQRGLPQVPVSNGETLVLTDESGRYELPVDSQAHRFIFVTVPAGYRPRGDFFRSTQAGENGNFLLEPAPERAREVFTLAQISDTHVVVGEERLTSQDRLEQDLQRLVETSHPDLIVASGDLTNRGQPAELEHYRAAVQTVETPIFSLFGGHDGNAERFAGPFGKSFTRNWEALLGPTYFSFDWGGKHFVLYPTEDYFFSPQDQRQKEQWLWQDLALQPPDRDIILVIHTPPTTAFLDQLAGFPVRWVLFGHWHSSKVFTHRGITVAGTPSFTFGGIDTTPGCFRKIRFDSDRWDMELVPLGLPASPPPLLPPVAEPLRLHWQKRLATGLHRAAPVCDGKNLFLSCLDESLRGHQGVTCRDAFTGETRWHLKTDASVRNSVAVGEGCCAAVSITGCVYVMETATGTCRWQAELPGYPERWVYTSPVLRDGTVYVGARSGYAAFDLATGELQWYTSIETTDAWSCYASPQVWENLLLVLISRRGLLALERETGVLAWERKLDTEYQYPSPVITGARIISGGNRGCLAVLWARSGRTVWHRPVLGAEYSTALAVEGQHIYAATAEGEVCCLDLASGQEQWRFRPGPALLDMTPYRRGIPSVLAPPVVLPGSVVVGGGDGILHLLDRSGRSRGSLDLGSPISAGPGRVEDRLYVGTYGGQLYCFGVE